MNCAIYKNGATPSGGSAPELGVKNANAEGSTYRPDWVPEDAKKDDTFALSRDERRQGNARRPLV